MIISIIFIIISSLNSKYNFIYNIFNFFKFVLDETRQTLKIEYISLYFYISNCVSLSLSNDILQIY